MHAVAKRLRVTPMALYRHVDDKNALLDGLVEVLLGECPLPSPAAAWDERLTVLAAGIRDTARRHPTAFPLLLTRPPGPRRGPRRVARGRRARGRRRPDRTPDQHGHPRLRRQRGHRPVPPARP